MQGVNNFTKPRTTKSFRCVCSGGLIISQPEVMGVPFTATYAAFKERTFLSKLKLYTSRKVWNVRDRYKYIRNFPRSLHAGDNLTMCGWIYEARGGHENLIRDDIRNIILNFKSKFYKEECENQYYFILSELICNDQTYYSQDFLSEVYADIYFVPKEKIFNLGDVKQKCFDVHKWSLNPNVINYDISAVRFKYTNKSDLKFYHTKSSVIL